MARQKVVKLVCDRCKRTELRPLTEMKDGEQQVPAFQAMFKGKKIKYDDLCTQCEMVMATVWENVCTVLKKNSPRKMSAR